MSMPFNTQVNTRLKARTPVGYLALTFALLAVLLAVVPLSMVLGAADYPLATLLHALTRSSADRAAMMILWDLRMPRILLALMIGAHLAISGLVLQATLRNPLAEPGALGVSSGATFGVMTLLLIANFASMTDSSRLVAYDASYMPLAAQAGGIGAVLAVYALSWRNGTAPIRLILMGVAVSATLYAAAMTILAGWGSSRIEVLLTWLSGNLYGRDWEHVRLLAPWTLVTLASLPLILPAVQALAIGDDPAASIGVEVERWRLGALVFAGFAASSAIAVAGPIAFVGLIVPHAARLAVGGTLGRQAPIAVMIGALLTALADLAGRTLLSPAEIPVGAVTAALGAPLFLLLLSRLSR
ncbi:ABC-type Fe3+-siderophore transport system, permease component [Burkholderia sp. OK233]|nr:ABC-type Fe3+-siderophore transport system, permease component [Burkholderia sp. OK233]